MPLGFNSFNNHNMLENIPKLPTLQEIWENMNSDEGDPKVIDNTERQAFTNSIYFVEDGMTEIEFYEKNSTIYEAEQGVEAAREARKARAKNQSLFGYNIICGDSNWNNSNWNIQRNNLRSAISNVVRKFEVIAFCKLPYVTPVFSFITISVSVTRYSV